jgi:N-acetyl-gamma-glutamyl-phosphate/LysW-gamma-L-alpha-aminoadipyl-6-phosphate reductase
MNVGILGGSGYAAGELLRLLIPHPEAEVAYIASGSYPGEYVYNVHPTLRGITKLKFRTFDLESLIEQCDLMFLATPHGYSRNIAGSFLERGIKVIDLSADFRLQDSNAYPKWYDWEHPHPNLLKEACYGLPELYRDEIRESNLVACGGCMATASILGLAPLLKGGLVEPERIIIDAKIGSSGGGSKPTAANHHSDRFGGLRPYRVVGHRHIAEIEQELSLVGGCKVSVGFTPHGVNMSRGILVTCHLWATRNLSDRDLWRAYRGYYRDEPFIRFVKSKKGPFQLPDPKMVTGTNYCDIGFAVDSHINRVVVFSAIDNIMKGASGQAVHCFNIMTNLNEKTGLELIAPR